MGMQPAIRRRSSFDRMATANTSNTTDKKQYAITQRRLTKSLDAKGRFRIQTRGSIYLIKCLWQTTGFIYCAYELIHDPKWFSQHFYYLNKDTVETQKVYNICALVMAYYCWEMSSNRYAKLQKSIAVHHWLSCIAAITIIYFDRFSPLITWYCIVGLFPAGIPINVALCMRASSKKYTEMNKYIQTSLSFAAYWYLTHLIILCIGACVIITNLWLSGYYNNNDKSLQIFVFILTMISMCGFGYNDILTLRALFELSHQNYAILNANKFAKSATNKSHLTAMDINETDSYYYAYPISGTRKANADTDISTDLDNVTDFTSNYVQQLYLDGDITTGGDIIQLQSLQTEKSTTAYVSHDSFHFTALSGKFKLSTPHTSNTNLQSAVVELSSFDVINEDTEISPRDINNKNVGKLVVDMLPSSPNTKSISNTKSTSNTTPIPDSDSKQNENYNQNLENNVSDTAVMEQIWNEPSDGTLKSSMETTESDNINIYINNHNNKPTNRASQILKMEKHIKSTPIIQITSPLTEDNISVSYDERKLNEVQLKEPQNAKHSSVKVVRFKKSGNGHESQNSPPIPKHRKSQTLPDLPQFVANYNNDADIRFQEEILPSEIEQIQSNLPPNTEIGVFKMTDSKQGTQQQVILVKCLKINANTNTNKNIVPITPSVDTLSTQSPISPTLSSFDHDKDEIVVISEHNDVLLKKETENKHSRITHALQLSQSQSNSAHTQWLKRIVFTINEVFSVEERMDDGIYLDFDDDELLNSFE